MPEVPQVEQEQETEAHEIRITSSGKIQAWVSFALEFLQKHENKKLVLHTLPTKRHDNQHNNPKDHDIAEPRKEQEKQGLSPSTAAVPRLITVVEIIKREFIKLDGTPEERTLHQYNEIGCLETLEAPSRQTDEEARRNALVKALEGKNHLRIDKTPYMKVTLCRQEIVGMKETYQGPVAKRLSRSAKARAKRIS